MRIGLFLCLAGVACAHRSPADRPIVVTDALLDTFTVAMPEAPEIQIDDDDCDDHDRAQVRASFEELQASLIEHGFEVIARDRADYLVENRHHITSCTYDGGVHGKSSVILRDRQGRIVEHVSLFPLWPEGLVLQLLQSERLAAWVQDPEPAPPPPAPVAPAPAVTSTGTFSLPPMETELDQKLAKKLGDFLALLLQEGGLTRSEDGRPVTTTLMKLGSKCVLGATFGDRSATERTACDEDALASAVEAIAGRLTAPSR